MSALTGHQDDGAQDDDEEVEVWDEDVANTISLQELRQKGGNGLEVAGAITTDENNKYASQLITTVATPSERRYERLLLLLKLGPQESIKWMAGNANWEWKSELIEIWSICGDPTKFPEGEVRECGLLKACGEMVSRRAWSNMSLYRWRSLISSC